MWEDENPPPTSLAKSDYVKAFEKAFKSPSTFSSLWKGYILIIDQEVCCISFPVGIKNKLHILESEEKVEAIADVEGIQYGITVLFPSTTRQTAIELFDQYYQNRREDIIYEVHRGGISVLDCNLGNLDNEIYVRLVKTSNTVYHLICSGKNCDYNAFKNFAERFAVLELSE